MTMQEQRRRRKIHKWNTYGKCVNTKEYFYIPLYGWYVSMSVNSLRMWHSANILHIYLLTHLQKINRKLYIIWLLIFWAVSCFNSIQLPKADWERIHQARQQAKWTFEAKNIFFAKALWEVHILRNNFMGLAKL